MGLALFKERRMSSRKTLTGLLPGRLVFANDRTDLDCKPIDVSRNGLGVISSKEIEEGTEMHLLLPDGPLVLQVAWTQPDFGKQNRFRYGLVTLEPDHDLEDVFVRTGCLR